MDRTPTDTFTAVVGAECEWILAASDAKVIPVEIVGTGFVGDPLAFGIPERTRLETDHLETGACESLKKNAARGTNADDGVVDEIEIFESVGW